MMLVAALDRAAARSRGFWSAARCVVWRPPAEWEATGPLGRCLCSAMSKIKDQAAAGDGVLLDAWLGLTCGPRWNLAATGQCSGWSRAVSCMHSEAGVSRCSGRADGHRSFYLEVVLLSFFLAVPQEIYSFRVGSCQAKPAKPKC